MAWNSWNCLFKSYKFFLYIALACFKSLNLVYEINLLYFSTYTAIGKNKYWYESSFFSAFIDFFWINSLSKRAKLFSFAYSKDVCLYSPPRVSIFVFKNSRLILPWWDFNWFNMSSILRSSLIFVSSRKSTLISLPNNIGFIA